MNQTGKSLILSLHARYETAWGEYNRADEAQPASTNDEKQTRYYALERAMQANNRETNALREGLLYQLPTTDEELTVLAYHAWSTYDRKQNSKSEMDAIKAALTAIFNYLVSESRADMEKIGHQLSNGAMIAFDACRYRTGQVED